MDWKELAICANIVFSATGLGVLAESMSGRRQDRMSRKDDDVEIKDDLFDSLI
jgi:hypothetical protein